MTTRLQKGLLVRLGKLVKTAKEVKVYKNLGIVTVVNSYSTSILPFSLYETIK